MAKNKTIDFSTGASSRGSHQLGAALSCERLWALRYHQRLRPITNKPWQLLGTLIHTCLAHYFASLMDEPPQWSLDETMDENLEREGEGNPDMIRQAKDCFEAFKSRYAGDSWVPLYVENEFKATIGSFFKNEELPEWIEPVKDEVVTCKIDLVCEWGGRVWVVDHKTSSGSGRTGRLNSWGNGSEYSMSPQVFQNLWIIRSCIDRPVAGFAIQRLKRSTPYDFDRQTLQLSPLAYEQARYMIADAALREKNIIERIAQGEKPRPNYNQCYSRWGPCDFFDVCSADTKEIQGSLLSNEYVQLGGNR